jgi:hypothetical protein
MKKVFVVIAVLFFLGCSWLFYEYLDIAGAAEKQVEYDIKWLGSSFDISPLLLEEEHVNKTHLQTQLTRQRLDNESRFIRHYRSLFFKEGEKSCLESLVRYKNYQPVLHQQAWLPKGKPCIN